MTYSFVRTTPYLVGIAEKNRSYLGLQILSSLTFCINIRQDPDPWEDLESRTPIIVPYTNIG